MEELSSAGFRKWNSFERIGFRFVFIFFQLFIVLLNNGAYPFWFYVSDWLHNIISPFIIWIGHNILQIEYAFDYEINGSGDTTYNYSVVFFILSISAILTAVWSIGDRKQRNYKNLQYWLTVLIRYYIALMLLSYGMVKIFKLQFPDPGLYRLTETYGSSTPMGLAWTFLGFSKGYNIVIGVAELCSLFLLFRRTATFGAIITLFTTLNIMAVNYFYDVPVKLLSSMLVAMTLFLLMQEIQVLFRFFFLQQNVQLKQQPAQLISNKWLLRFKCTFKFALLFYAIGFGTYKMAQAKTFSDSSKHFLYGIYKIENFNANLDSPSQSLPMKWDEVVLVDNNNVFIRMENDTTIRCGLRIYTTDAEMKFEPNGFNKSGFTSTFKYDMSDSAHIKLSGLVGDDSVSMVMVRQRTDNAFRLTRTGFHWISDRPNNQ